MTAITISYRRSDAAPIAGRIFDRLSAHYGEHAVFMDIDKIPFGVDFRSHIREILLRSDVLIAVIGRDWLGRNAAGGIRMQEASGPGQGRDRDGAGEKDTDHPGADRRRQDARE